MTGVAESPEPPVVLLLEISRASAVWLETQTRTNADVTLNRFDDAAAKCASELSGLGLIDQKAYHGEALCYNPSYRVTESGKKLLQQMRTSAAVPVVESIKAMFGRRAGSSARLSGRVLLWEEDGLQDVHLWCRELVPMAGPRCSVEEWAETHMRDACGCHVLRELFGKHGVPMVGDVQVLFDAEIRCWQDGHPGEEEWDEEMTFSNVTYQAIPPRKTL